MPNLPAPLVTVVIPLHNYEQYIVEAIQSIQSQTLNNFECFIVNDRSTDNSETVAREAIIEDARFHILVANNGNLSATRNAGIAAGSAPFVCCLDADDRMGNENFLDVLVTALEADRTLGIAFTGIRIMDADGNLGHLNAWPKGYDFDQQAQRRNQVPSLCVFRREAWKRAGGFRPYFKYAEDAEFWTTVGSLGYTGKQVTTEGWFHYRLHNKSASQVHRTGEIAEPDWLEFHPWSKDGQRPFAADGKPPLGSWPVRFYHQPDVSIIIPVGKGHEEIVKDALHSVEGQTHRLWECIVVNDSAVPLDLSGFPWAKVISTRGCIGTGGARNLGASRANSKMLVFLDADDILKPTFLAETLKAYRKHGRYIYTDWLTDDRKGKTEIHPTLDYSHEALRQRPSLHLVTVLIPQRWFEAVGGFDETMDSFEDVDFFMNLYTHGYCGQRIAKPLVVYNLSAGLRRKVGDSKKDEFKKLLIQRYRDFMEGKTVCNCIDPPKGLQPAVPTLQNAAEYQSTYGDMIKVELVSQFAPMSPTTFRGPATRVNYGYRAKGEIFNIWEADFVNSDGVFERVDVYETEPSLTEVPPPPTSTEHSPIVTELMEDLNWTERDITSKKVVKKTTPKRSSVPRGASKQKKSRTKIS